MDIQFKLGTKISRLESSSFFRALENCDNKKDTPVLTVTGDIDKYGYLFSPQEIDFDKILEYWDLATYYDLKIQDLTNKIIEHMNRPMERTQSVFQQLIQIHRRTHGRIPIDPLFDNTHNIVDIYKNLKTNNKTEYISFIFNDNFDYCDAISEYDYYLFEVFNIMENSQKYGINTFLHPLVPDKKSFLEKFNHLTQGLIDQTFEWKNVVCAGGMILESISNNELNKYTDIDLFLYGSLQEQIEKAQQLCDYFYCRANELSSVAWFGSVNHSVITICFESIKRVVQIICTSSLNMGKIIFDFDIYSNSVLYNGIDVMATKKWFNAVETKITEHNIMHQKKNKRLYKTIKKGFLFNKEYHLTPSYLGYVLSGQAERESEPPYYPGDIEDETTETKIAKMCKAYHAETFTTEIIKVSDLKEFGIGDNKYFESINCTDGMIEKGKIRLEKNNNNGIIKIFMDMNDEDEQIITFATDYYPCDFVHKKNCTGCQKDDENHMFHTFFNAMSMIGVGDEFNEKYKHICESIVPHLVAKGIRVSEENYDKKMIKISNGAKIILNDQDVGIDKICELYINGIDPTNLPLVKIKCCVKSYSNRCFSVRCICAEFKCIK